MNTREWNEALNALDSDIVEAYIEHRDRLIAQNNARNFRIRVTALAACFLLLVSSILILPILKRYGDSPIVDPPDIPISPTLTPPTVSTVPSGSIITGKCIATHGDTAYANNGTIVSSCRIPTKFFANTVIHATAAEILPDRYYIPVSPGNNEYCRVVKLSVAEAIRGEGLPSEIFLSVPADTADAYGEYEDFILSLEQTGIENYMMINQSTGKVTYFPHMFTAYKGSPDGGSAIAFNNGIVSASFWDKIQKNEYYLRDILQAFNEGKANNYPAEPGSTLSEVKEKLLYLLQSELTFQDRIAIVNQKHDYITADDVFFTEEGKRIKEYLEPSEKHVFKQSIWYSATNLYVNYNRIINGFVTEEKITVWEDGTVTRTGEAYGEADLERLPDIGGLLAELELSQL
ncbi:MAG: hypothetical protein IJY04_03855 [Clostridia bacterium]|nr:hypothetical protein [Clostridia bacterium]